MNVIFIRLVKEIMEILWRKTQEANFRTNKLINLTLLINFTQTIIW
jgi:hypothetical protein